MNFMIPFLYKSNDCKKVNVNQLFRALLHDISQELIGNPCIVGQQNLQTRIKFIYSTHFKIWQF